MTLATIRANIWRGGGDVAFVYKSNGRRHFTRRRPSQLDGRPRPGLAHAPGAAGHEAGHGPERNSSIVAPVPVPPAAQMQMQAPGAQPQQPATAGLAAQSNGA